MIQPIIEFVRRRHARRIQLQYPVRDEQTVKAIRNDINADRCDNDPDRTDGFAMVQRDDTESRSTNNRE